MKDEIKEILEFDFQSQGERIEINEYERDILKDCITNLQQENKQLREEIKKYQKELEKADSITQSCIFQGKEESEISFRNCLNKMTDYKTRIDKAIEYIEYNDECLYTFEPDYDYEEELVDNYEPSNYREDLLEILKGE